MPIGQKNRRAKKRIGMGDYQATKEQQEAYNWGIRNNLRISPRAAQRGPNPTTWYVEIFTNGRWVHNKEEYGPGEVWEQVFKYYEYYFNKREL